MDEIAVGRKGTKLDSYWCSILIPCKCEFCEKALVDGRYLEHTRTIGGPPPPEGCCGGQMNLTEQGQEFIELYTRDGKCRYERTNHRVVCPLMGDVQTIFIFSGFAENAELSDKECRSDDGTVDKKEQDK